MKLQRLFCWVCLGIFSLLGGLREPLRTLAKAGDPYALIDAVNQLRTANSLYTYQIDSTLMMIAQEHSNWQASLGTWTHEGSGGTNETQRAIAAGYGGGANVHCDENVAFGYQLTPQGCIDMWMDAAHLANMLSTRYVDVGAGATVDGENRVFYTLDVCYIEGGSLPEVNPGTPWPTVEPFFKVQTVTPLADGSITHIVKPGQSLIAVANAYGIALEQLLALNGLREDAVIYPDDQLIVQAAFTATAPVESTPLPTTAPPTSTRRPTRTPTLTPQRNPTQEDYLATPTEKPASVHSLLSNRLDKVLLAAIIGFASLGLILVVVGGLLKRGKVSGSIGETTFMEKEPTQDSE